MGWSYVARCPIIHGLWYTLAVFGTCWLRRPVFGGIIAIASYVVLSVAITSLKSTYSFEPINVYNSLVSAEHSGSLDFSQSAYPLVYGTLTATILATAIISSRLARPFERPSLWPKIKLARKQSSTHAAIEQ